MLEECVYDCGVLGGREGVVVGLGGGGGEDGGEDLVGEGGLVRERGE